ncbi:MAG: hypothetical protein WKG07_37830 [Hymenobacter sp.]
MSEVTELNEELQKAVPARPRLLPARRVGLQKPGPGEVGVFGHDFARAENAAGQH